MEYPALEKFMSAMDITYKIKPDSIEYVSGGYKNLCIHITVFYRGDIELDEYRCYRYKQNVDVRYSQGHIVKGVKEGILAALGDDYKVENYFEKLARIKATEYFEKSEEF
jgi:hypothetical protein